VTWRVVSWNGAFMAPENYTAKTREPARRARKVPVRRKSLPRDWAAETARSDFTLAA